MGIMGLIEDAKIYIRRKQYERAVAFEGKIEQSKAELKRIAEEERYYKRLQRIQRKKENINRLKATPLKRVAGVLQRKEEVQKLKNDTFSLGDSSKENPFIK